MVTHRSVEAIHAGGVTTVCRFTGRTADQEADAVILVTERLPDEQLALDLTERVRQAAAGAPTVRAIGDAHAPGTIAAAMSDGRRFAERARRPRPPGAVPPRPAGAGVAATRHISPGQAGG